MLLLVRNFRPINTLNKKNQWAKFETVKKNQAQYLE